MVGTAPLVVADLVKHYLKPSGEKFVAVNGISFSVAPGECFGLLGPNGAGKSTTIDCITGFYPLTSGEVLVDGINIHKDPKLGRQHLGICAQDDTLDSDFDLMDQMTRYATFFRIPVKDSRERAKMLLKKFGLDDKAKELISSLSGGMRRRLQVARALMTQPKVLVLDEPTTGLDPDARRVLWDVLREERERGTAILLSTHYMDEAERLCDRIGMLHQGKLLDIASPAKLIQKYVPEPVVEEEVRPGVVWKRVANLEDVFLKLTGNRLGGVGVVR